MKRIIRLTEDDLTRIVKRVISENNDEFYDDIFRAHHSSEYIRSLFSITMDLKELISYSDDKIVKNIDSIYDAVNKIKDLASVFGSTSDFDYMVCIKEIKHLCIKIRRIDDKSMLIKELKNKCKMLLNYIEYYTY